MRNTSFWNDKTRATVYGTKLSILTFIYAVMAFNYQFGGGGRLYPGPFLLFILLDFAAFIPMLLSQNLITKPEYSKPIVALDLTYLLLATMTGDVFQTAFPMVIFFCLVAVDIFRKRPQLALIYTIPATLFFLFFLFIPQMGYLSDGADYNGIVWAFFALAPLIIANFIVGLLVVRSRHKS